VGVGVRVGVGVGSDFLWSMLGMQSEIKKIYGLNAYSKDEYLCIFEKLKRTYGDRYLV
jgi:hypothetical protein